MGVYPVTLSLLILLIRLIRLSLLGADCDRGASCDDRTQANARAPKTRYVGPKRKARQNQLTSLFGFEPGCNSGVSGGGHQDSQQVQELRR
jgi:hypothetical protein